MSETPEFIKEMTNIDLEIYLLQAKMYNLQCNKEEIEQKLNNIEFSEMEIITNIVDDKGKQVYSNADKRQTELKVRLLNNNDYKTLLLQYTNNKKEIFETNRSIESKNRKFKIFELLGKLSTCR